MNDARPAAEPTRDCAEDQCHKGQQCADGHDRGSRIGGLGSHALRLIDRSYGRTWVMRAEGAAYRGGCRACQNLQKERYAMKDDTSIIPLRQPGSVEDPLTEIAREGARRMLVTALEAEIEAFLDGFAEERLADGRQRLVRHGHAPERKVQTGIGALKLRRPKIRDRAADVAHDEKIRFTSHILPKWARRSRSLDALLPVLYLRGISTGDFQEALSAILGAEAPNLSPGVISRLAAEWETEYERWQHRDLSARPYVYIWADGIYLQARMEPEAECILVVIGATPEGKKELVGFHVGRRESSQSWRELLVDLKARGLAVAPEVAVGDGALGFWKALDEVFPGARHQRCWVHKVANVLNKFPKSLAPTVKSDLRDVWQAETRAAAETAMDTFAAKYGAKYAKAVACLTKDREALLVFFDFPAEHWDHLRTANPIESVFATVRHRTVRAKGALSQKTAKLMVFTLVRAASKKWRRLKGANQLPLVVDGIKFTDGLAVDHAETRAA
jgi:transposase-like protein